MLMERFVTMHKLDIVVTSSDGVSKTGPTLAPGDIIEVCEGQLMHL